MRPVNILKITLILAIWLVSSAALEAEDYQYQYFNKEKDKYVPFSDYIPKVRLHYKTVPHYLEDFYELYGMKQHYDENSLRKNIQRMKTALNSRFRHPSQALVKVETEEEYLKYRRLMFMHLNILILRNYMRIASKYDMQKINFYSAEFAKEIRESLDMAEGFYRQAMPYWEIARKYALDASRIKITTDLGFMESERFSIISGNLSYRKIIDDHIKRIGSKRQKLNRLSARN